MAFSSLFTLLDDIASVLDDVALMSKMAAKKTAGVVGDDLALNANQVSGVQAERELPIVWAVAKGSLINKLVLIPLALLLAVFAPAWITPLLMIGGAYLCFEGVEKLLHSLLHRRHTADEHAPTPDTLPDEQDKIRGAIRTDFILSAEIIIIALGVLQDASLTVKILALFAVGIGITVAVYGLVALIVKADDFGAYLAARKQTLPRIFGATLLAVMPWFMRSLSVVGTLAMFLVGGGIFTHALHDWLHALPWLGNAGWLADLIVGVCVGLAVCALVLPLGKLVQRIKSTRTA